MVFFFAFVELGQRITNAFDDIDETIGQFDWYLFPIGVQKMLPTILIHAQKPVTLDCFGKISCLRESFKKVI